MHGIHLDQFRVHIPPPPPPQHHHQRDSYITACIQECQRCYFVFGSGILRQHLNQKKNSFISRRETVQVRSDLHSAPVSFIPKNKNYFHIKNWKSQDQAVIFAFLPKSYPQKRGSRAMEEVRIRILFAQHSVAGLTRVNTQSLLFPYFQSSSSHQC